jgi:magnesium-transporting ATPase (P-type)
LLETFGYSLDKGVPQQKPAKGVKNNRDFAKTGNLQFYEAPDSGMLRKKGVFDEFTIKVSSEYGYFANYLVKGVNHFTNGRKRISMIICDSQKGSSNLHLIVKGEEEAMKDCLDLEEQERSQLRQLMTLYRNAGKSRLIIGSKKITVEEMRAYTTNLEKISKSKRDQLAEHEKLADSFEKGLYFVGCVGMADNIREDAKPFICKLQEAMVDMSLLSGDSLDSCITITKELGLTKADFSVASDFYNLAVNSENRLKMQMKRAIEDIFVLMKKASLEEKQIFLRKEADQKSVTSVSELPSSTDLRDQDVTRIGMSKDQLISVMANKNSLKKPLLLNGNLVKLVSLSKDKDLLVYLKLIMLFTDRLIGFDLDSSQKVFLLNLLKSNKKTVVAVGDGFNDIGMLSSAHASVQVFSQSVPLITSDIVIHQLSGLSDLYFDSGFKATRNIFHASLLYIWMLSAKSTIVLILFYLTALSHSTLGLWPLIVISICLLLDVGIFGMTNSGIDESILMEIPALSRENSILKQNYTRYCLVFLFLGFAEGVLQNMLIWLYFSQTFSNEGIPVCIVQTSHLLKITFCINCKLKCLLFYSKHTTKTLLLNLISPIIIYGLMTLKTVVPNKESDEYFDLKILPKYSNAIITPIYIICMQLFFSMMTILWFKYDSSFKFYYKARDKNSNFLNVNEAKKRVQQAVKQELDYSLGNSFDSVLEKIRETCPQNLLDTTLSKIMHIDSISQRLGVSKLTNQIRDIGERTRFRKSNEQVYKNLTGKIILASLLMMIVEVAVSIFDLGLYNYQLHNGVLYTVLLMCIPLVCSYIRRKNTLFKLTLKICTILSITLSFILIVLSPNELWLCSQITFSRMLYTTHSLEVPFVFVSGLIFEGLRIYQ